MTVPRKVERQEHATLPTPSTLTITDALRGEHGVLKVMLAGLETATSSNPSPARIREGISWLKEPLLTHAQVEEEFLLQPLEKKLGSVPPVEILRMEHEQIEAAVDEILKKGHEEILAAIDAVAKAASPDQVRGHALALLRLVQDHFAKEEQAVFHVAEEVLPRDELTSLGRQWAERRNVSVP